MHTQLKSQVIYLIYVIYLTNDVDSVTLPQGARLTKIAETLLDRVRRKPTGWSAGERGFRLAGRQGLEPR
jgi:hypothetical protein